MNKSRHVTFRCTQEQYDAIKRDAGYCGESLSQHLLDTYFEQYPIDYKPPVLSKHHLDRERQLENRFKDKS